MAKNTKLFSTFHYHGISKSGQKISGDIQAPNLFIAKIHLYKKGIIANQLIKKPPAALFVKNKDIRPLWKLAAKDELRGETERKTGMYTPIQEDLSTVSTKQATFAVAFPKRSIAMSDIALFSRQLATMVKSGIPLVQSFDIVAKGQKNSPLKKLIEHIKLDLEMGLSLSESLSKHPRYFNELFYYLVHAGEKSGSLDLMLDKIATYKEKIETIKKRIKKAFAYPICLFFIALIITVCLLIFVVPQFESLFHGFQADLPVMTQVVIRASRILQTYWHLILSVITGLFFIFIYAQKNSLNFNQKMDTLLLKLPIIGLILKKAAIARFSRTLSICYSAGLPLFDALKSVAGATGNFVYSQTTNAIREEIAAGQSMSKAVEHTHLFPNMAIQMITIGEESGNLENMLNKIAEIYEEEVDNAIEALSSLFEPIIISILGILIGGLVIAMYLPVFKLGTVI